MNTNKARWNTLRRVCTVVLAMDIQLSRLVQQYFPVRELLSVMDKRQGIYNLLDGGWNKPE